MTPCKRAAGCQLDFLEFLKTFHLSSKLAWSGRHRNCVELLHHDTLIVTCGLLFQPACNVPVTECKIYLASWWTVCSKQKSWRGCDMREKRCVCVCLPLLWTREKTFLWQLLPNIFSRGSFWNREQTLLNLWLYYRADRPFSQLTCSDVITGKVQVKLIVPLGVPDI